MRIYRVHEEIGRGVVEVVYILQKSLQSLVFKVGNGD